MNNTNSYKKTRAGDAAVEGLLNGIVAGVVMAIWVLSAEFVLGAPPLTVLGMFDVGGNRAPLNGLFTHIAVSGMYGVGFGILALGLAKGFGARMSFAAWLVAGALYGMLIFGIAEWVILPRANSPLQVVPTWTFALAHLIYGIVLAGLCTRNAKPSEV